MEVKEQSVVMFNSRLYIRKEVEYKYIKRNSSQWFQKYVHEIMFIIQNCNFLQLKIRLGRIEIMWKNGKTRASEYKTALRFKSLHEQEVINKVNIVYNLWRV